MRPWDELDPSYQHASRQQALYSVRILETAGFEVRKVEGKPVLFHDFTKAEIEFMAELEHGRWNVERLTGGWRPGPRNDEKKLNPALVPWKDLEEATRNYDRNAVAAFPKVLAVEGLEVTRRRQSVR